MPLHTLGMSRTQVPGSIFGLTFADGMSLLTAYLFFAMPGIDHRALYAWIVDNCFNGSVAAVAVGGTFFSHKLLEWGGLAFYELWYRIDASKGPFSKYIASMKLDPNTPWAWDAPNKAVGAKHQALERKSIAYIIKFHSCVTLVQALMFWSLTNWVWRDGSLSWSWVPDSPVYARSRVDTVPSKSTIAWQCLVGTFIGELGFYLAHRLMHETRLYKWHKQHHEYIDCTVYASFFVSFADAFITDIIPAGLPLVLLDMHQITVWMFTLPLICNSLRVHCGYDNARLFGFNPLMTLPLCTDAERTHDMHHRMNMVNYGGAYFIWDRIFGTYYNPDEEIANRKAGIRRSMVKQPFVDSAATKKVAPVMEDTQDTHHNEDTTDAHKTE